MDSTSEVPVDLPSLYDPLNEANREVRSMRVVNGNDSNLVCEVKTFSLNDEPIYKALSYCWTEDSATEKIQLNDRPFYIRPNLYNFLREISKEESHWIFVDAICVNQDDMDERSQQVRLMRDIYEDAAEVVAWLGCEEPQEAHCHPLYGPIQASFASARQLTDVAPGGADDYESGSKLFEEYILTKIDDDDIFENDSNDRDADPEVLFSIWPFLQTPYWNRTWIVQEIHLARALSFRWQNLSLTATALHRLCCRALGTTFVQMVSRIDQDITLRLVLRNYSKIVSKRQSDDMALSAATVFHLLSLRDRMHGTKLQPGPAMLLSEALGSFSQRDCTVPYDRIFGKLGLTYSVLRADYRMPKLELIARVMFEALLQLDGPDDHNLIFNVALSLLHETLVATELDFDHPTVAITTKKVCKLVRLDAWVHRRATQELFRMNSTNTASYEGMRSDPASDSLAGRRANRLFRFCGRYRPDTVLLSVDYSGSETYAARMQAVENIFFEVVFRMMQQERRLPRYLESILPHDSPTRLGLTSALERQTLIETSSPVTGSLDPDVLYASIREQRVAGDS